ncbi:hypothetical protein [Devosia sp. RR2S18]|uniref:hypothetical protein n=1 Tax=Devosia rhizosphaerae TaxID=3049774 RepID=UPI002540C040|nr:hypothetical protein [Devosia sp. RR2S18]WIJ26607.1 hypothetical protein QOV41_07605 [Devosia sp. RR2S18]
MQGIDQRLAMLERVAPVASTRNSPANTARAKLSALVLEHGGRLDGESLAEATARVLGITSSEVLSQLKERAGT